MVVAVQPTGQGGTHIAGHVSLHDAGRLARSQPGLSINNSPTRTSDAPPPRSANRTRIAAGRSSTGASYTPHTPVSTTGNYSADQWDGMLNRLGAKYNVPPLFLKAVMLSESGGNPNAVGDSGHSVGLFQLHDQGYGYQMGDSRYDPEINAERAVQGLAEAWHAGERAGYQGEYAVRAAYDYSFNPGGGFAYQGDSVVRHYNQLLENQGLPPLS
jgi:hypothetical protein